MPRSKPGRRAPGSRRGESSRTESQDSPRSASERESRGGPGRAGESRVVHDGGKTRRRGAGAGPARTPSAVPERLDDTDAPDADLWR
jgi:hypothetical protein